MDFNNIRHNLKLRRMPIFRIVIPCLLFLAISDKTTLGHILNNVQSMHFQSPETIIMNAVNISRFLSLQYSFIVGLSYLFIELASFVAIAIAVFALIKYLFGFELVQDKKFEVNHSVDFLQSNDIYLKISKFIC